MLLPLLIVFAGLHVLYRPRKFRVYLEKLSLILPQEKPKGKTRVWLHAVSVGEVISCEPLIRLLRRHRISVWLSSGTEAGLQTAKKKFKGITCFYFPFDFRFAVARFLKRIKPDVVLLCELEIWPSFVWSVHRRGTPLYLISGRMVEKDFRRYKRIKWFFRPVFAMFSGLFMQNEIYMRRMESICHHPRLKALGTLKFDVDFDFGNATGIRELMPEGFILCAASTHRGDECLIIRAFQKLLAEFSQLKLVLVPRNPHRSGEIIRILEAQALPYTLRSQGKHCTTPVFLVDTIGEMIQVYEKCDIVIIGGSFSRKNGGHNVIEPALYGRCMVCGNHMENFEDVYALFRREHALVPTSRKTLLEDLKAIAADGSKAHRVGEKAFGIVQKNRGVSEKIYSEIFERIPKES
jgi:3-deoxy-D-manno-octulosonic-acid transferase